ncbi:MAG: rhomboid family intramembrane serine protease [Pseudomonadota bacterium]
MDAHKPDKFRIGPVLLCIGGSAASIELMLQAADLGLIGSPLWRNLAYQNGAFWPGLLRGWQPNYSAQPLTMFVTYAFLHGGFWHLAGNLLSLGVLAQIAARHVGLGLFLFIYALSALGGALCFALLPLGPQPMVGASGALFGLAAAWQYWDYAGDQGHRRRRRLARGIGALVGLNLVLWVAFGGALAWQTHLGGVLAGWLGAWLGHKMWGQ